MDTSKIITGVVSARGYTVTAPIVKEDYGLYLQIEGVELPETYQVDFSNDEHNGTSVTMIGNSDGVLIPSQFISTGKDVFAFLYHVGADYGRTVYKFRIPNKVRPDRTDETPTPEEQSVIDQAISVLNSAVEQTAQDVIDADASAQSASADAERAESARDTAQTYANNAQASATSSSQSATASANSASASAQSASQSAQIKADVEDMVDDAQGYANSASQSATASATSATQAQGYANSASASAQSASGYASQAQTSAQTASSKAQDASTSAQTASQKATEASQSASQALTYKTDAETAKTASQTAQGLAESARDSAISAKEDAESARDEAQSLVDGISGKVEQIDSNTERIESLEDDRYKPYVTDSASGSIASFSDGADDIPLKSLVVDINPVQSGSGDPSPTNIRPINGFTGANVKRTGKNLLNPEKFEKCTTDGNGVFTFSQGGYVANLFTGQNGVSHVIKDLSKCLVLPAGTYTYSVLNVNGSPIIDIYSVDDDGVKTIIVRASETGNYFTATFTLTEQTRICLIRPNSTSPTVFKEPQIEVGSTATDYEAYTGTSVDVDWSSEAGAVYGGKLDVLTGKLTVYPYYASYNGETLTGEWISDRDVYAVGTTPTIGAQVVDMSGTGTEVQLEAHEIASLLGANNIFADTGDASVEYRADAKLYIERLTAPDSADMIADSNIVSGQYFMVGNDLYKATVNIASGAQIVVGTNATKVSLSEALNQIKEA